MKFYDLDAWKSANEFAVLIYKMTDNFPREEKFGLVDQLRRPSSSVGANIAEGFGRFHFADKSRFYYQARGSVKEVQIFLLLALDLKLIDKNMKDSAREQSKRVEMLLSGLLRSTNQKIK